jgi:hypothetical protein
LAEIRERIFDMHLHELFLSSALPADIFQHSKDQFGTADMKVSQKIDFILTRNVSLALLANHVSTRAGTPAIVAVEGILAYCLGDEAFTNDMKQFAGWRVRQIVEAMGGTWVKAGVKIRNSHYSSASTYRFDVSPFAMIKTALP